MRTLLIRAKKFGEDHSRVWWGRLPYWGMLKLSRLDSVQVKALHKRSLAIHEEAFGPQHPTVADCLLLFADFYQEQRQFAVAELLYNRSLEINEHCRGSDHLKTAVNLEHLAELYRKTDRGDVAERAELRAASIRKVMREG